MHRQASDAGRISEEVGEISQGAEIISKCANGIYEDLEIIAGDMRRLSEVASGGAAGITEGTEGAGGDSRE